MSNVITLFRNEPIYDYRALVDCLGALCGGSIVSVVPVSNNGLVVCMEQYYFRNDSYASITMVFENFNDGNRATIVGFGGGDGVLNFSFGANYDYAFGAANVLRSRYGYYN